VSSGSRPHWSVGEVYQRLRTSVKPRVVDYFHTTMILREQAEYGVTTRDIRCAEGGVYAPV
jgi:hypothetical protein